MWRRLLAWLGPATGASIGLGAVCVVLSFVYSETGPIVVTAALNLSLIVALFEAIHRELVETRSHWANLPPRIDSPYLRRLAEGLVEATGLTLEAMLKPTQEFRNEGQFFRFAESMLSQLGPGDRVIVACAETMSRWQKSTFIKRWVAANYAAATRGVEFVRILLGQDGNMPSIAFEQAANGIRILFVESAKIGTLPELSRIPPDMGIAVVNGARVYMHWGNDGTFYGCFVDSRVLAGLLLDKVFPALEANSDAVKTSAPPAA